ncbi:MAG TPA: peptidyl-prolyl cis-trans isomerase [Rickettsiales bacterium]|nr:peptidyl-prolyl cis-trans isomerase [Rickettsiales bacterium]
MLDKFRTSAHTFFGKLLLILLVLSFGIWGIGDVFRGGLGTQSVAVVGDTPISIQDYSHVLHRRLQALQAQLGKSYNEELVKKLGVPSMVREEMINNILMRNEAKAQGIEVGDQQILKIIASNPAFQDKNGKFDKGTYLAVLRQHEMTDSMYVGELRKQMAVSLLADTITSGIDAPEEFVRAVYINHEEKRSADLWLIAPSALKNAAAPTEQDIKTYYDAHSQQFLTPEYRSVSYVDLKIADIQPKIEVSDEAIKQAYDDHAQDFQRPQQRQVEQMVFKTETDADKAYEQLAHSKSFAEVEKSAPVTNKGKTSMGLISKDGLEDEEAQAIFSLKEGEVTKPIKSAFGWHIFHVSKIVQPGAVPLADVRDKLIQEIRAEKAGDTVSHMAEKLEDAMAGGMTLEDAAKSIGLNVEKVEQISREGKTEENKPASIPAYDNFLETAFTVVEKDHSQAMQGSDGSYFVLRVDNVTPASARPLAQVKDQIVSVLKAQNTQTLLKQAAEDAAEKLRSGKKPNIALFSTPSGSIKRSSLTTADGNTKLSPALVKELFTLAPHGYTHAYPAENGAYMIASLSSVIPAPANPDAKTLEPVRKEVKETLVNDALVNYLTYLRLKYPVSVNNRATGAADESAQ